MTTVINAAARLRAFTMQPWAGAMFKKLKRFDIDPGPGGMASSDGEWVEKDVGDEILKALKGWKSKKTQSGTQFFSATDIRHGINVYWDEDEDVYCVYLF